MTIRHFLLFIFTICLLSAKSQDTIRKEVFLVSGTNTIVLNDILNLTIHTDHDSSKEYIQIFELALLKDSLIIAPGSYDWHSYKSLESKNITIQYSPKSKDRLKIPISHIDYIIQENSIKDIMQPLEIISALSGLIIAPLVSLGKPFKTERYYVVAGTSLAVFTICLTIDNIWGKTLYRTKKYKNKKIWAIE